MNDNMNGSALAMSAPETPRLAEGGDRARGELPSLNSSGSSRHWRRRVAVCARPNWNSRMPRSGWPWPNPARRSAAGDVDKNARKRLVAARDEVDFARARVAGLEEPAPGGDDGGERGAARSGGAGSGLEAGAGQRRMIGEVYKPAINTLLDAMRV